LVYLVCFSKEKGFSISIFEMHMNTCWIFC